jgi:hypothetical protein
MMRWNAGSTLPEECFEGGAEYFVVSGSFSDESGCYGTGAWLRLPAGSQQSIHTGNDTVVYCKTGHLIF